MQPVRWFNISNAHIAYLASLLSGIILVVVLYGSVPTARLYGWLILNVLSIALRIWFARLQPYPEDKLKNNKYRKLLLLTGIAISGVVWALSAWWLFPQDDIIRQTFLIFVLMGMTAGTPATSAPNTLAFLCFTQPILHTLSLRFVYEGTHVFYIMAILTQIYNLALLITSHNFAKIDQSLRIAKEAAEAASLAKSEFLANISHEIRTPMNAIVGINHLLKQSNINASQQDLIEKSLTASRTLLSNIENILDYSKIETQKSKLTQSTFQLQSILDTVKTLVELDARKKDLRFICHITSNTPNLLKGDPVKLIQILSNLAKNAIKFTDKGKVELIIKVLERTTGSAPKALIHFSIHDTGIGIAKKDYNKLFKTFSQVNTTHSREYGGTGLGLSISQQLAKLMGSVIEFESVPQQGSTFYFSVWLGIETDKKKIGNTELEAYTQTSWDSPPSSENIIFDGYTVLLIEDDELNQLVAHDLLSQTGLQVEVASTAQQAFAYLRQHLPDAILLDIQMPHMDGYETIAIIRSTESWKNIPVICLTAHASSEEREKSLLSGMDDFLTKPIDPGELHSVLYKWLKPGTVRSTGNSEQQDIKKGTSEEEITKNIKQITQTLKNKKSSEVFLEKAQGTLQESFAALQQQLDAHNWKQASLCAHQLRGSANFYASSKLQQCLHDIDKGRVDSSNVATTQQLLETECNLVLELLREELGTDQ